MLLIQFIEFQLHICRELYKNLTNHAIILSENKSTLRLKNFKPIFMQNLYFNQSI